MARYFNITGPNREQNFGLDPLKRVDYPLIERFIERGRYFSVCSPRQSGKTTFLLALKKKLNEEKKYRCLYCDVGAAQAAGSDTERGMRLILSRIAQEAETGFQDFWPYQNFASLLEHVGPDGALLAFFEKWLGKEQPPKPPVVLLMDGIDLLRGKTLASVLTQLRAGQVNRPLLSPQSVILSGVRDVRDRDIHIAEEADKADNADSAHRAHRAHREFLVGRSGSDVRESSVTLYNFTQKEIKEMCAQYTAETGHEFQENAYSQLYILTGGRPWLVNAILCEALYEMGFASDTSRPLSAAMINMAKDHFIGRQGSYMDQLAAKLAAPGVRETLLTLLVGGNWEKRPSQENLNYLEDLELIQRNPLGWGVTNAIYRELIPQVMGMGLRDELSRVVDRTLYILPDGRLDFRKMILFYQKLFCDNSLRWGRRYDLEGALAQVLLHAFLRYVLGNRGRMEFDYALSSGHVDVTAVWNFSQNGTEWQEERAVIEIRFFDITKSHDTVVHNGVLQVVEYAKPRQPHEVYLLILDEDESKTWYDRLFREEHTYEGTKVYVYGL